MGLRHSYTLIAPFYDLIVARASLGARRKSLKRLQAQPQQQILISGIGSGLDIPHLPVGPDYHGIDLTYAMLKRAKPMQQQSNLQLYQGDVLALPFQAGQFDWILMHLILAVVPDPQQALREAERVLKPGGKILILDKFLSPGRSAPLRRLLSPLMGQLATRMDVVFEELLADCPSLELLDNQPALLNGWFRLITLQKRPTP